MIPTRNSCHSCGVILRKRCHPCLIAVIAPLIQRAGENCERTVDRGEISTLVSYCRKVGWSTFISSIQALTDQPGGKFLHGNSVHAYLLTL